MADFRILKRMFLYNQAFGPGQEDKLVACGFTVGDYVEQEKRGNIVRLRDATPEQLMTPAAQALVEEHELDVAEIEGTGTDGRITVKDVRAFMHPDQGNNTEVVT